ncbi:MAG TPA: helix-hairpin-helix domain-containing protein [Polyangiaceae bacterium]|nr:helix-hairpin-helix domain-containing protein [Polyangiaceae bacterium]
MSPLRRGGLSSAVGRVIGSRFAKPIARIALVTAGLLSLAVIGRVTAAGALGSAAGPVSSAAPATSTRPPESPVSTGTAPATSSSSSIETPAAPRLAASAEDPVVLNTAFATDLRRLPGIGEKRANAILALRVRMGRFHALEDLLKVRGIGRATLKRLRPLLRLDAKPPDAGAD